MRSSAFLMVWLVWGATQALGMFMQPTFAPISRLVSNVEAYLVEHPNDAKAYYNLGRLHFLAYANDTMMVPSVGGKDYPAAAGDHLIQGDWLHYERDEEARSQALKELGAQTLQALGDADRDKFYERQVEIYQQLDQEQWKPEPPQDAELLLNATTALAAFQRAIAIEPKNGLYHLGLASLLETISRENAESKELFARLASEAYAAAFKVSAEGDRRLEMMPITGLQSIVSFEAGTAYLRLNPAQDSDLSTQMRDHVEAMKGLKRGPVTPIVFTMDGREYDEIESNRAVDFDFNGDGRPSSWRWLKPDVGILVWVPSQQSEVTSGFQMFGNFTFNQLWTDGYAALAALDDNQDGELRSGELVGIRVWFDTNTNGVAEPAELTELQRLGVVSILVDGKRISAGGIAHHPKGIQLDTGQAVPSWDWLAQPAG